MKGWPSALLARRTRTIGMCSFDARSEEQMGHPFWEKGEGIITVNEAEKDRSL